MLPAIEAAEGKKPQEGSDEDESEQDEGGLEENQDGVGLDVVDRLPGVVVELVGVDEEVPAEEAGQPQAEEETLGVHDCLGDEHEGGEDAEPLEEVPVWNGAGECSV